jgi:hypothetical protein
VVLSRKIAQKHPNVDWHWPVTLDVLETLQPSAILSGGRLPRRRYGGRDMQVAYSSFLFFLAGLTEIGGGY